MIKNALPPFFMVHSVVAHHHFKDGNHAIPAALAKNPVLKESFMALRFIEPKLLPINVLHCGNSYFGPFLLL